MLTLQRDSMGAGVSTPAEVGDVRDVIVEVTVAIAIAEKLKIHLHGLVVITLSAGTCELKSKSTFGVISVDIEGADNVFLKVGAGQRAADSVVFKASERALALWSRVVKRVTNIEVDASICVVG